jgi:hypothetical protein
MKKAIATLLAALAVPALAGAGEIELTGYAGHTFPFYSQSFKYDPGPITVPIPGVSVEQGGSFELKASGGNAFAGGITFYATDGFGFEVRYDHADITVESQSSAYNVRVGLPAPLDPVVTALTFSEGTVDLGAANPFSLNLKLRTGGHVRFTVSGGASHLGDLEATVEQTIGLGVIVFNLDENNFQIGTLGFKATGVAGTSSWGGNLGLGLQIPLGKHAALVLEGRGFYFPKRTLTWEPILDRPLTDIEQVLLDRVQERLPPVEFEPWWAQATAGLSIRF